VLYSGLEAIPGYTLKRKLGEGGFGQVWSATSPHGESVALKFIDCQGKPGSLIAHEIRIMRGLTEVRHPNFIRLHGVCSSPPYIVITMERAEGSLQDLHTIYQQEAGTHVPSDYLLDLLDQAAAALDYLAAVKLPGWSWGDGCVQHCDVKPSNLLLVGDTLKVADFGLCCTAKNEAGGMGFRGTPPYAAPELYEGRASSRTDQYGLAVTFCELCIGSRAFLKDRRGDDGTYQGSPIDLRSLRERELGPLGRALSERWTDRWPSCRQFIAALKGAAKASRRVPRVAKAAVPRS
jgi:serine/threonine protein kinase